MTTGVNFFSTPTSQNSDLLIQSDINNLIQKGKFTEAEKTIKNELKSLLISDALKEDLFIKHAYVLNKLKKPEEATAVAEEGLKVLKFSNPQQSALLLYELAISLFQREMFDETEKFIDIALKSQCTDELLFQFYGLKTSLLAQVQRFADAEIAAKNALNLINNFSKEGLEIFAEKIAAFFGVYANILNDVEQYEEAYQASISGLAINQNSVEVKADLYHEQARSLFKVQLNKDAIISLKYGLALSLLSDETIAHLSDSLATIYLKMKEFEKVNELINLNLLNSNQIPNEKKAKLYNMKVIALLILEDDKAALAVATLALTIPQISIQIKAKLCCQQAAALNNLGQFDKALEAVEEGLKIPALPPDLQVNLIYTKVFSLKKLKRFDEIEQLRKEGLDI